MTTGKPSHLCEYHCLCSYSRERTGEGYLINSCSIAAIESLSGVVKMDPERRQMPLRQKSGIINQSMDTGV